jgi:hypothetical protein
VIFNTEFAVGNANYEKEITPTVICYGWYCVATFSACCSYFKILKMQFCRHGTLAYGLFVIFNTVLVLEYDILTKKNVGPEQPQLSRANNLTTLHKPRRLNVQR